MSSLLGTIPYENIQEIRLTCNGGSCITNATVSKGGEWQSEPPRMFVDYLISPSNEITPFPGSWITLETSDPMLDGIYKVKSISRNAPFDTVETDTTKTTLDQRIAMFSNYLYGVSGQIYFGKRRTGGTVSKGEWQSEPPQMFVDDLISPSTDFGQVMKAAVMGIVAIMLIRYLIKD